jgi:hypothetical protein
MKDGIITGNTAGTGGGIGSDNTFILDYGTISGNNADRAGGVLNSGTMTMNDGTISGNTASAAGGGVDNFNGLPTLFTRRGGTISGNRAAKDGGIENTAIVNLWRGSVSLNAAAESTPSGGGIFNFGDGKINDVHGNTPDKIAYSP